MQPSHSHLAFDLVAPQIEYLHASGRCDSHITQTAAAECLMAEAYRSFSTDELTSKLTSSFSDEPRLVSSLPAADSHRRRVFMLTPSSELSLFLLMSSRCKLVARAKSVICGGGDMRLTWGAVAWRRWRGATHACSSPR